MIGHALQIAGSSTPSVGSQRFSRHQLASVIYRERQLALRQARLLKPLGLIYRYLVLPLRGQWRHWHRLRGQVRLLLAPRWHRFLQGLADPWPERHPGWQRRQAPLPGSDPEPLRELAVGLLTYNNPPAQLQSCLRALEQAILELAGVCRVRVLVLDNGHSSAEALSAWPWLERPQPIGNVGFGAGHNHLMKRAFADGAQAYVAMNPDGRAHPRLLRALCERSQACAGGALVEALQFPCEHPKPFDPTHGDTPWASGACLLIPRAIQERLGGFDDTFFMYCEDVDLSWRARAAGFRVVSEPRALFLHQVTNRPANPRGHALMLAAGVQLGRKWGRPRFAAAARLKLRQLGAIAGELPPQTLRMPQAVPRCDRWAASFGHAFSFARPRW